MKYIFVVLLLVVCSCNENNQQGDVESETMDVISDAIIVDSTQKHKVTSTDTFEPFDEVYVPSLYTIDSPYIMKTFPSFILAPSEYHGEEVTEEMKSVEWYKLSTIDGSWHIKKANMVFTTVYDPIVDDDSTHKTGCKVSGEEGEILIANVNALQEGRVSNKLDLRLQNEFVRFIEGYHFDLNLQGYSIYTTGQIVKDENGLEYTRNFKLWLKSNEGAELLYAVPRYGINVDKEILIKFVGDINGDDKPDVIISELAYNSRIIFLYLSNKENEMLELVAMHSSVGC